jgi:hypothetical protein
MLKDKKLNKLALKLLSRSAELLEAYKGGYIQLERLDNMTDKLLIQYSDLKKKILCNCSCSCK